MKKFADMLKEGTHLTERVTLDQGQINDLAGMTKDALGKYSKKNADDASEFIGSMGEDISGFGTGDFNAVMKAYMNESVEDDPEEDDVNEHGPGFGPRAGFGPGAMMRAVLDEDGEPEEGDINEDGQVWCPIAQAYLDKVDESEDDDDDDDDDDINEATNFSSVSGKIKKELRKHIVKFKTDSDGGVDSFYALGGAQVSLVVDDDSIMVSSEAGDYKEFKHSKVTDAVQYASTLV